MGINCIIYIDIVVIIFFYYDLFFEISIYIVVLCMSRYVGIRCKYEYNEMVIWGDILYKLEIIILLLFSYCWSML